ncbi:hypothetical protein FF36_00926 [Frankia torreyi]|uniref:Uncharacterized protein n=1 Tax=Frankia torreyi TaxID=1856 RepID=A0A0D8BM80_9ACTN|nr:MULTISPECIES: hypothetical protein [Frankia]KJE24552.1 hypothetical protein FF36_00926 [Frankia torreyi]KQM07743.1 hypothetical protein FF86_1002231 [Frankia sp. CpI1-P]
MSRWTFQRDEEQNLEVSAPSIDRNTEAAVLDFLESDVGPHPADITRYVQRWQKVRTGELNAALGNGTVQEIEGDRVLLESLYEQWESVYFTIAEFEELLDDYAAFLDSRRRPDANG